MSTNVGGIVYTVDADTSKFMRNMSDVDKALANANKSMGKTDQEAAALGGGLSKLSVAFGALATVAALRSLQQTAEQFTVLQARIDRLSGSAVAGAANYSKLLEISSKTGADMGTTVKVWESLTGSLKELGKSNTDILTITETLQKMGSIGGSSAEEMKNGLRQLGQSFSGGIVRGEEFNSMLENIPEVARQIAKGMGIPFGQLRNVMLDSKLTSEVVFNALKARVSEVDADFAKMPRTVAQATNAIENEFGNALSKLDKQSGFSVTLAKGLDMAANAISKFAGDAGQVADVIDMMTVAGASMAAIFAGRVTTGILSATTAKVAMIRTTIEATAAAKLAADAEVRRATVVAEGAAADLARSRAAVAGAVASVEASRTAQAGEIARTQAALGALAAEKQVEAQRLKSQVSEQGRQATIARMVEIRTAESAMLAQLARQEAALTATTVASSSSVTTALAARTVATEAAATATAQLSAATAASTGVATAASTAMGVLRGAMAFLGGPTGVIMLAAFALYQFGTAATTAKNETDALTGALDKLTFAQLGRASSEVKGQVEDLNKELGASRNLMNTMSKRPWESDDSFKVRQNEVRATLDDINAALAVRKARLAEIQKAQDGMSAPKVDAEANAQKVHVTAPDDQKVLDNLKQQLELAKLTGVERAKAAAIQKLGTTATDLEKTKTAELAAEIYTLEEAKKGVKKETTEATTGAKQNAEAVQKLSNELTKNGENAREAAMYGAQMSLNEYATPAQIAAIREAAGALFDLKAQIAGVTADQEVFKDLGLELGKVGANARELAQLSAERSLSKFATPEEVQTVRDMAGALYDLNQGKQLKASVDPMAAESSSYEAKIKALDELAQADVAYAARANELKLAATTEHELAVQALQEATFRAASAGNAALMAGIDAMAQGATNAISGILSGTMNMQEALSNIANTVLNAVIGSFAQAGAEYVKQEVIKRVATQATTAAQTSGIATVGAVQAGTTATIAGTTTAAAATTGSAVATSMAPAAGLSSIASFGGAAVIGGAALLGTMLLAKSFGGGRRYGGGVNADSMYQVNESGRPEIFNSTDGKQYMMPNTKGEVVSNANATKGQGGGSVIINVNNYGNDQVSVQESQMDDARVIDIIVGNMMDGGAAGRAVNQITGTNRPGV